MNALIRIGLVLCFLLVTTNAYAEKICVKGSNPSGKKVKLTRSVVPSSGSCAKGSIELLDTASLVAGTVAAGAVSSESLADGSVTEAKLADGAVSASKLAAGAVTADKVPDAGLTTAKITSTGSTTGQLLTSNGSGGWSFQNPAAVLPANVALLDATTQTFTGENSFPNLRILTDLGAGTSAPIGEINRNNVPIAWARVTAGGFLDAGYNIDTVSRTAAGRYLVTLFSPTISGFSLIPIVTPEIDPDGFNAVPVGLANMRIPATNQVALGETFEVFMYNGSGALVDNDFQVIVMGR